MYHRRQRARIVLFGMGCAFTGQVLAALLAAPEFDLRAVVLPESLESTTETGSEPVVGAARSGNVALIGLPARAKFASPAFRSSLADIAPDAIVVACFPWRLPNWLLTLPEHGCLNIHPSLLPEGRGPEPVFWAFRWELIETGVTIHVMDSGFDTGPVVSQRTLAIPGDATIGSLEATLASVGAELLIGALPRLRDGSAVATPQVGDPSRYAPVPGPDDLVLPTSWSAHRAARFIRAVVARYGPATVLVHDTGQRLAVSEVVDTSDNQAMTAPVRFEGAEVHIRFSPGVLICRLATRPLPLRLHGAIAD